jgi:plasmid stability protein
MARLRIRALPSSLVARLRVECIAHDNEQAFKMIDEFSAA